MYRHERNRSSNMTKVLIVFGCFFSRKAEKLKAETNDKILVSKTLKNKLMEKWTEKLI
jgi:hypothetical protein